MASISHHARRYCIGSKRGVMQDLDDFTNWLVDRGAIIEAPTNQWEVIRFKAKGATNIIYQKKNGMLTFTGESQTAYRAFKDGKIWRAVDRKRHNLRQKKQKLADRDGQKCFYHGERMEMHLLTIEHLLNISQGGTDHDNNLCLACASCNSTVGNWPLTKKMLWRDQQLNKSEGTIVRDTALTIWALFNERFKSLSLRNLLTGGAPKTELRHIIEKLTGEPIR